MIVSISALVTLTQQNRIISSIADRHNAMITETIKGSITDDMLAGHSEDIRKTFSHISDKKLFKTLRIIDMSGKVLNSADPSEIGTMAFSKALLAYRNGIQTGSTHTDGHNYVSFSPIYNAAACNGCHDPSRKILGLLEIETPMDYIQGFLDDTRRQIILTTAIIILLLMLSISFFLSRYLDIPLRSLISSMQQMEKGEFSPAPVISSSKEMNLLSTHYNHMVTKLQQLLTTTVANERDLARAQEKLIHHQEILSMNERLEEQLTEIEGLNISLEERIEESEEANYKIADLAGELEDKNSTLERAISRLSTLHKVGLGINSTMELDTLFHLIVKSTKETLQAEIGYIALHDPDDQTFSIATIHGYDSPVQNNTWPASSFRVSSWVIDNRRPILISNIAESPQFGTHSPLGFQQRTLLSVPLLNNDKVVGTINVVNHIDGTPFTNEDLELLITIAGQASVSLMNASLYEEQQKTYLSTIQSLVSAIEASDSYTRGHSERVTHYSLLLAKSLDLPQERLKIIERAAILHDIGKIGIDLSLLNKREILSIQDVVQLREHPAIGVKILEPIGFLHDVSICISQHHERFDGQGYPNSHAADALLLESRILAIADAFDAMTSDRPYRKALPIAEAIRELHNNAGTQFDPQLVPQFITALSLSGSEEIDLPDLPLQAEALPLSA